MYTTVVYLRVYIAINWTGAPYTQMVPNISHKNNTALLTSSHLYPHTRPCCISNILQFSVFIILFDIRHLCHFSHIKAHHGLAAGQMGQSKSRPFPPFRLPSCFRLRIGHEEVAEHKEESDCWVIIGDLVLDLSKYVAKHPGGKQSILNLAGGDATEIFDLVHHRSILKKHGLQEGTIALKGVVSG